VKIKELLESWQQHAAAPLAVTDYSVRLPIDAAARLDALAQLFPGRTREQIIAELLGAALEEVAASMPYVAGKQVISRDDQGDPIYEDVGLTPRYMDLTRKLRKQLEAAAKRP
jgi:predicted DNA-binding protein